MGVTAFAIEELFYLLTEEKFDGCFVANAIRAKRL